MAKPKIPTSPPPEEPTNPALAELLRARGFDSAPAAAAPPPAETRKPTKDPCDLTKAGKLVVRRERKGRGGKTVTVVSGIERPPAQLEAIAQAMRKALGCGSTVEQGTIVLLGDIVPRAQAWLEAHGATRIVCGN
jgi:translation initiation factor 1